MLYWRIYTSRFIPERFAAVTYGFIVLIRPQYRNDPGILPHELVHVRQFWRRPIIDGFMYRFSRRYRLRAEVEAYREQMRHYATDQTDLFARFLVEKYRLNITLAEAYVALTRAD